MTVEIKRIGGLYGQATRWGVYDTDGLAPTITAAMGQGGGHTPMIAEVIVIGTMQGYEIINRVYSQQGLAPSIHTMQGGNRQPKVMSIETINAEPDGVSRTLKAQYQQSGPSNFKRGGTFGATGVINMTDKLNDKWSDWQYNLDGEQCLVRIRKLTPKETWRLMGFTDEDFHKAEQVNSNAQLYKQAGNSICVPVLEAIFKELL